MHYKFAFTTTPLVLLTNIQRLCACAHFKAGLHLKVCREYSGQKLGEGYAAT